MSRKRVAACILRTRISSSRCCLSLSVLEGDVVAELVLGDVRERHEHAGVCRARMRKEIEILETNPPHGASHKHVLFHVTVMLCHGVVSAQA